MSFLARWKSLDYYCRTALLTLPLSIPLLAYFIAAQAACFILPVLSVNFIYAPALVGNLLSCTTYLARILDMITGKSKRQHRLGEKILTSIGVLAALSISTFVGVSGTQVALAMCIGSAANVIFTVNQIGNLAGLCNRMGGCIDDTRLPSEKRMLVIAAVLGFIGSVASAATMTVPEIHVLGVTPFINLNNVWASGALFVCNCTSLIVSCTDYATKGINFVRTKCCVINRVTKERVEERANEYRGSFVGSSTGLIVGALNAVNLVIIRKEANLLHAVLVVAAGVSIYGGLCSRSGRLFDNVVQSASSDNDRELEPMDGRLLADADEYSDIENASLTARVAGR